MDLLKIKTLKELKLEQAIAKELEKSNKAKSKRKSSRKYKLGGLLGDNKSVNVHIILVEDYEAVVRSKDGTYLNDVNLKKDKVSVSPPDSSTSVKVMTIHKSKGLQFPVVMIPFKLESNDS